jgi:hypothetical protein
VFSADNFTCYVPSAARHVTTGGPLVSLTSPVRIQSLSTDCGRPHCDSQVLVESITRRRGVEVQLHSFFTSALYGGEWLNSRPGRFNPGKEPRYPLNRRTGGPKSGSGRFQKKKISYAYRDSDPGPSSP